MSNDVLAVIFVSGPRLSRNDQAAIGFSRAVADAAGGACDVLLLGSDAAAAAEQAVPLDVRKVIVAEHSDLASGTGEGRAAAIAAVVGNQYRLIAATSATGSRDCLPRVAAKLRAPMVSDVLEIRGADTEKLAFTKPSFSGNLLAEVESIAPVTVATCRGSAFEACRTGAGQAEIIKATLPERLAHPRKQFVELNKTPLARPELTEADTIVSGGRGTRGAEGFKLLEELADLLGAAVGASRAVVDSGWMPNDFQVGQTGKIVAPKLYLCAGLSGAIQHLAGMRNSKTIVAINKDAQAPIFEVADYGLAADLFDAVPRLTAAIKAARQR